MSAHGGNGSVALRWFDINVATNTLRQSGLIADQELSFYYGSIAVNDFGDVVIGFTGSGPSQFASAYAVEGHTPLVLGVIAGVTTARRRLIRTTPSDLDDPRVGIRY
jgi:fluoride ion exporter CrcB/FEX